MDLIGSIQHLPHELRRNEIDTLAIAYDEIARHDGNAADSYGNVDARKHDVPDGSGIDGAEICRHVDFRNSIEVSNTSIHDEAAPTSSLHYVIEEVVPDNGPVHFLAEEVHDKHITRLQHVNRGLIGKVRDPNIFRLGSGDVVNIRTRRHELNCEGSPDHGLSGM